MYPPGSLSRESRAINSIEEAHGFVGAGEFGGKQVGRQCVVDEKAVDRRVGRVRDRIRRCDRRCDKPSRTRGQVGGRRARRSRIAPGHTRCRRDAGFRSGRLDPGRCRPRSRRDRFKTGVASDPCKACSGSGRSKERTKLRVKIPAGIEDGSRLRSGGNGDYGSKGGPAGDLYIVVQVRQHEIFEREGDDLQPQLQLRPSTDGEQDDENTFGEIGRDGWGGDACGRG